MLGIFYPTFEVVKVWPNYLTSVLISLQREIEERGDITGLFHLMTKFGFIATLHLLCDVLPTINRLSETFQKSSLDFSIVKISLRATLAALEEKKTSDLKTPISTFIEHLQTNDICVKMNQNLESDMACFTRTQQCHLSAIWSQT